MHYMMICGGMQPLAGRHCSCNCSSSKVTHKITLCMSLHARQRRTRVKLGRLELALARVAAQGLARPCIF
jgi:hypothetical protein